jgi:glycolate oxidase FAD binding subunit
VGAAPYAVAGAAPPAVAAPGTTAEAAEVVRLAGERGWAVVPFGGGTQIDCGYPPRRVDLVLSTRGLDRVVDYQPDDMTVTVEPGVTLAALEATLASRGQFLPLDPPLAERATAGGTVAAAKTGPWRAAYGTPRDWVIGCRVIGADGTEVRGGGQVVKNVAGYDLPKLYTGSFGSLGLITELTFKVMPRPPAVGYASVLLDAPAEVEALLARVMDSDLQPSALELRYVGEDGGWALLLQFMHVEEAVAWQQSMLTELARGLGAAVEAPPVEAGEEALRRHRRFSAQYGFCARLGTISGRVAEAASDAVDLCRQHGLPPLVQASAGTGQVYVAAGEDVPLRFTDDLRALAQSFGAACVFLRLPPFLAGPVDPWGEFGPEWRLMKSIKDALDPAGVFSPGRFVGRL